MPQQKRKNGKNKLYEIAKKCRNKKIDKYRKVLYNHIKRTQLYSSCASPLGWYTTRTQLILVVFYYLPISDVNKSKEKKIN